VICGWVQTIQAFVDAGLVDRLIVYKEDMDVGEWMRFLEELLKGWVSIQKNLWQIMYANNDTSSHSG
jgi:dihydrofolate reductase